MHVTLLKQKLKRLVNSTNWVLATTDQW